MDFAALLEPTAWMAILTLTFLEIVLGIDNIVFISIISGKLPENERKKATNIGLFLAMLLRIGLLFGITWLMSLTKPISWLTFDLPFLKGGLTWQSLIILGGGLFLLYKSVKEIHHKLEDDEDASEINPKGKLSLANAIIQILLINIVFSFDSILTAVGMVSFQEFGKAGALEIMGFSVIISIVLMMVFAVPISKFVNKHPTIQMLALSFLILIGVMLLAEASHLGHLEIFGSEIGAIPKGYIYFAIFFALLVEVFNMQYRKRKSKPVELHNSPTMDDVKNQD
jgi:predicted tellurium resistance membrane protein TerC